MRGATNQAGVTLEAFDISIHAPHEGCDAAPGRLSESVLISIHAPHEGCDNALAWFIAGLWYDFNPRTP